MNFKTIILWEDVCIGDHGLYQVVAKYDALVLYIFFSGETLYISSILSPEIKITIVRLSGYRKCINSCGDCVISKISS